MMQPIGDGYWLDDEMNMGFTNEKLCKLGVIWTLTPKASNKLVMGVPFANVESSRCLGPLRSPVEGTIVEWYPDAIESPDSITDETPILRIKLK